MGMSIAEKILAVHSDNDSVSPGQFITGNIDLILSHIGTGGVVRDFSKIRPKKFRKVFDPTKVAVIFDHFVPAPKARWAMAHSLIRKFVKEQKKHGLKWLIYTDILRDGMLTGVSTRDIKKLKDEVGMRVIASGGIARISDIKKLKKLGTWGVIVGKALYEKRFTLRQAIRSAQ